jgi:hypothetical protein
MKTVAIAVLICLLSLNSAVGLCAQEVNTGIALNDQSGWERVGRIPANEKITMQLLSGQTLKGKFVRADEHSLTLLTKGDTTSIISRADILRLRRKSAAVGALLGTGAGVAGGAAVGAAMRGNSDLSRGATSAMGAVLFGLAGAAAGGLIGIERTVYENRSPRQPHP